ncbi:MAG: hypothetical protein Q9160_001532 [Pyrenula sp. 1 TL-2023]
MNTAYSNNENAKAAQAQHVSRYRSARLPTSTRQVTPENPGQVPAKNANSVVRSRSRYHRIHVPKYSTTGISQQKFSDTPSTKQRHLATLAALTGDSFIPSSDDENATVHVSQQTSKPALRHRNIIGAEDEQATSTQNVHPRWQSPESDKHGRKNEPVKEEQTASSAAVTSEKWHTSPLKSASGPPHQHERPRTQQRHDQKATTDGQIKTRVGASERSTRHHPNQLSRGHHVEERGPPLERGKEKTGQRPNAATSATGDASLPSPFPGIDAPVSAINAGERKVLLKYQDVSTRLSITPNTKSSDLVEAAAKAFNEDIRADSHRLMEFFHQLALERALRTYEDIREVMNSWDADADNHLFLVPKGTESVMDSVDTDKTPDEQPEASMYIYHSSRPGRWDKRWMILRSDGQIAVSKKEGEPETNLCHLSDFDIYIPTRHQKKRLKSPKKICYAIKSQQKSSMFLSGQNFIHFFATSDKGVAETFYRAVWSWRSWYLVNVMGKSQAASFAGIKGLPHQRRASIDATSRSKAIQNITLPVGSQTRTTPADRGVPAGLPEDRKINGGLPPTSFPKYFAHEASDQSKTSQTSSTATSTPKRLDSQRQSPHIARPTMSRSRSNSMTSETKAFRAGNPSPQNSPPKREKPKPLVDLTPVFQEAPQHVRKGRGVAAEPGKQLIDQVGAAEAEPGAVLVPSATSWRRLGDTTPAFVKSPSMPHRSGTRHQRGKQSIDERRPNLLQERPGNTLDDNDAFTGGLLKMQGR